jgi:hypothetical protein
MKQIATGFVSPLIEAIKARKWYRDECFQFLSQLMLCLGEDLTGLRWLNISFTRRSFALTSSKQEESTKSKPTPAADAS